MYCCQQMIGQNGKLYKECVIYILIFTFQAFLINFCHLIFFNLGCLKSKMGCVNITPHCTICVDKHWRIFLSGRKLIRKTCIGCLLETFYKNMRFILLWLLMLWFTKFHAFSFDIRIVSIKQFYKICGCNIISEQ